MQDDRSGTESFVGWMGRGTVAKALGVSVSTVRRLEGSLFHPVRADDGAWYFDPAEVERARSRVAVTAAPASAHAGVDNANDGELAARLFPLFERGASFTDVVQTTCARPAAVRSLFQEWQQGYRQPPLATAGVSFPAEKDGEEPADEQGAEEETSFAEWEREVRSLEREQASIERMARRHRHR